jgi:hypothetical protein
MALAYKGAAWRREGEDLAGKYFALAALRAADAIPI